MTELGTRNKPHSAPWGASERQTLLGPLPKKVGREKHGALGAASKRASWKRGQWGRDLNVPSRGGARALRIEGAV